MAKEAGKLTLKQQLFVESYLGAAAGNATEAARMAGYKGSEGTLRTVAAENLTKPNIAALIADRATQAAMSADEVIAELAAIAKSPWKEFLEFDGLQEGTRILARLRLTDKLKALELLGKYHKLFTDKVEQTDEIIDLSQLTDDQLDKYEQYRDKGKSAAEAYRLARSS